MEGQWERVDEDTAVTPRLGQDPPPSFSAPTLAYTYRPQKRDLQLWAGDIIGAEEPAGGMAFETAQRREPDCRGSRPGRCVGAG